MIDTSRLKAPGSDGLWYLLDVPSFADGNGDGIGDLPGITAALDYLSWIGVETIWLLPFFPSPRLDNGYDIVDHYNVDPRLGTMADFHTLCDEARRRDLRIVVDLVLNHTSDRHPWFQSASRAKDSPYRNRYVWTDDPASRPASEPVFPGEEESVWEFSERTSQYYLHRFLACEPELNPREPAVRTEYERIVAFWLEQGVDGFRIDALPFLGDRLKPGAPSSLQVLTELEETMRERHPGILLALEADLDAPQLEPYAGPIDHPQRHLFNFFLSQHILAALAEESGEPVLRSIATALSIAPWENWINFVRNADEASLLRLSEHDRNAVWRRFAPDPEDRLYGRGIRHRLASLLDGDSAQILCVFSLIASLPGLPLLTAGDEVGVRDRLSLPGRYAVRTPMQWRTPARMGLAPDLTPTTVLVPDLDRERVDSVTVEGDDLAIPGAEEVLGCLHQLVRARKKIGARVASGFRVPEQRNDRVLVLEGGTGNDGMIFFHNLSRSRQHVTLPNWSMQRPMVGTAELADEQGATTVALPGYGFAWCEARLMGESGGGM